MIGLHLSPEELDPTRDTPVNGYPRETLAKVDAAEAAQTTPRAPRLRSEEEIAQRQPSSSNPSTAMGERIKERAKELFMRPTNKLEAYQTQSTRMLDDARNELVTLEAAHQIEREDIISNFDATLHKVDARIEQLEKELTNAREARRLTVDQKTLAVAECQQSFNVQREAQLKIIRAIEAMNEAMGTVEHHR